MRFDVVVVGLGAFGSQALWRLARRGLRVAGIEQYRIGHAFGSSHGTTRLFRLACLEHPGLVPLARASERLWRELEAEAGAEVLTRTGGLMVGPESGRAIAGTRRAAQRHDLPVVELDVDELRQRFPQHAGLPDHYRGLWDPDAGVLRPEVAVEAAVGRARAHGASVLDGVRVDAVDPDGAGVRIRTATGELHAEQVVVATGPWLQRLVPQLSTQAVRVPQLWFRPRGNAAEFDVDRFPVFIRHYDDEHTIWGHGATHGEPVKVGLSLDPRHLPAVDADRIDRSIDAAADWGHLSSVLATAVPGLDPTPVKARVCMITNSADGQFTVGRLPGSGRVLVAGGCSGHGFKHASGIGESVARHVTGEDPLAELAFVDPARFASAISPR